jgi:hypothetical protein
MERKTGELLALLANTQTGPPEELVGGGEHFVLDLDGPLTLEIDESVEDCAVLGRVAGQVQSGEEDEAMQRAVRVVHVNFLRFHNIFKILLK